MAARQTFKKGRMAIVCALMFIIVVTFSINSLADGIGSKFDPVITTENVIIVKKMSQAVVASTGKRYTVSEASIIVGRDGRQEHYQYWSVPCNAMITYGTDDAGKMTVHRIEVLNTSKTGAGNHVWGAPR